MASPKSPLAALALASVLVIAAVGAEGHETALDEREALDERAALETSRAAIGRTLSDQTLRDRRGQRVRLSEFAGKPLVVSLIYTSCSHTCPLIVQRLADAVEVAQDLFGADGFSVATIGFDIRNDTPARMQAYARDQGIHFANWRFLSGDGRAIEQLTAELGFLYFPSAQGFDHLAQTTVIDGQRRVFRHFYGDDFGSPALVEPLKQLIFGGAANYTTVDGLVNRLRLFCTIYDPTEARYRFDYSIFIGAAIGFTSLLGIGFVLVRAWIRANRAAA